MCVAWASGHLTCKQHENCAVQQRPSTRAGGPVLCCSPAHASYLVFQPENQANAILFSWSQHQHHHRRPPGEGHMRVMHVGCPALPGVRLDAAQTGVC